MQTGLKQTINNSRVAVKIREVFHKQRKFQPDCVVLIAGLIKPRIAKIGYALRKKGYEVILLLEDTKSGSISNSGYRFYDRLYLFSSPEDVYCKCLAIRPLAYHIFTEASVSAWAEYLMHRKSQLGKVVYDQYDVYRGMNRIHNRNLERREKYCFENADGLCCRSFETQYLKQHFHYKFNGKRILFLDYCWNKYHYPHYEKSTDESLQIVYGGRILPPQSKDVFGQMEWEGLNFIADSLKQKKGTFTVIPVELTKSHDDFLKLEEKNPFFKVTRPMKYSELLKYESNMDYGIDCLEFQYKMNEYERQFAYVTDYRAKARYYATNKFFDYLDAGIPIIYGRKNEMFGRYFARYGVAIPCAVENLPHKMDELKKNRNQYAENIKQAKEKLAIENQIERLIDFYQSLWERD